MAEELDGFLARKFSEELGRRDFLRLGATTAGLVAMAACGGGNTPSSGTSSAATGPDFKLGVVLPYSAVYAELGDSITKGMLLYFDKVSNVAGNRKIVVLKEDEGAGDPSIPLTKTKKLVEQDGVDMVTGIVASPNAVAIRDYIDTNKVPTLISNAGANVLSRAKKSPFMYRTSFSNWQPSQPMGKYLSDQGIKKLTLVYSNYAAGTETASAIKETYPPAQVVREVAPPFPNTSGDFASYIAQINASKPDGIYVFMSGTDAVNFMKQSAQTLDRSIKVFGSGFFLEQDVLGGLGDLAGSFVQAKTGLHWALTLDNKENQAFVKDYQSKYGKKPDVFAVQGYDTGRVIVETLNTLKGKMDNRDNVMKAISQVSFNSPRGPFKFDSNSNNVINTIYIRELIKDPQLGYTNRVISSFPGITDPGK
jgi:branched-chain amino acid transport system substrate-binding protein